MRGWAKLRFTAVVWQGSCGLVGFLVASVVFVVVFCGSVAEAYGGQDLAQVVERRAAQFGK